MPQTIVLPPDSTSTADGIRPAGWWHHSPDGARVVCDLCPRACELLEGKRGFCFVRQNLQGRMVSTTYGRSTGFCVDPVEKKPLNHFYPGSAVLSFGTAGCNLGCRFCQNWEISKSRQVDALTERADPETVARAAQQLGCRSVAFTYNDPVIWAEYAIDCAKACRAVGVKTVAVTAGYITPLARKTFYDVMDAANVDLKGFSEEFYRELTIGHLAPVQDTLRWLAHETGVWLEVTNLVIPDKNDSEEELKRMSDWLVEALGPDVPVHFTAFHPDFRLRDVPHTPPATLAKAHEIAVRAGLNYVYTGNVSDTARSSTYCPGCGHVLIGRDGYLLTAYNLDQDRCRHCGKTIPGRFGDKPGNWGPRRQPVRIAEFSLPPRESDKSPTRERGDNIAGLACASGLDNPAERRRALVEFTPTPEQERAVFQAAGRRLIAEVLGQRPPDQPPAGLAAQTVAGVFVTLRRSGKLRSCCGAFGESLPLVPAIERAAIAAARHDQRFPPISPAELPHLEMDVTLLTRMENIAARGAQRRNAVLVGTHGLRIVRGDKHGLLLPVVAVRHSLDAEGFLRQVCLKAGLPEDAWQDEDALLTTFHGHAIKGELKSLLDEHQSPTRRVVEQSQASLALRAPMGDVRAPAVAGMFYPGDAAAIDRMLGQWLPQPPDPQPWAGAIVPHAGWIYSGRLAAAVFSRVRFPSRIIILAAKHRREGADWALAPYAAWNLPGCRLDSDPELAGMLVDSVPGLRLDAAAHAQEHAIEVQLPIIARVAPQARVVGICIHGGELADLQRFGRQMADVLRPMDERPLLVVSSDLNHYADDRETRRRDRLALNAIAALEPERLYRTVRDNRISMCGMAAAVVALTALRCLDALHDCCEVGYATSAEVSGDVRRCVGYAGILLR